MSSASARLIVAASEASADLLYATRFFVPDEIIWFEHGGKSHAVFSPLEIDRARREAAVDVCLAQDDLIKRLRGAKSRKIISTTELLLGVLRERKIRRVEVPASFPLALARFLEKSGIRLKVAEPFFPEREIKTREEILKIQGAQRQAEAGLGRGLEVLRKSTRGKGDRLRWLGRDLTSEVLRAEIDAAVDTVGGAARSY
ncbi:MAG: aminopeptidase P family protein, partial [Blastochloris sp.]|nr:aminopeptidase P family protein [Blastochloris sp.]